jgi:hypothetical protein
MKARFRACLIDMEQYLSFAREQYFWEAERRDKLNSAAAIPIGLATASASIGANVAQSLARPFDNIEIIVLIFVSCGFVASLFFAYDVVRFFLGPIYKYVADAESAIKFGQDTDLYVAEYPNGPTAIAGFSEFLIGTYARCASINCRNNDEKSTRLYRMNRSVLAVLICCIGAGFVLLLSNLVYPTEVVQSDRQASSTAATASR